MYQMDLKVFLHNLDILRGEGVNRENNLHEYLISLSKNINQSISDLRGRKSAFNEYSRPISGEQRHYQSDKVKFAESSKAQVSRSDEKSRKYDFIYDDIK